MNTLEFVNNSTWRKKWYSWCIWCISKAFSIKFIFSLPLHIVSWCNTHFLLYARTLKDDYRINKLMKMALQIHHIHHGEVSYA